MSNLSLNNIKKTYENGFTAVHDFTLDIEDKEFIVLVGPSGCGKTTSLRMIAGLEDISGGELLIDGKLMNEVPPKDRDIAMVFQNYALYPHMTVYENMAFGLKLRKLPKKEIEERVNEAANILELTPLLKRKPKQLSGGQRQRVALGRAIVRNPKVFLMDEPLSNLDAKLRVQMRTEITKLHHQLQTTFVYVTHDQTEAMTMGTRIVIMKDGIVQQIDTPQNAYKKPKNLFVASFIGSPEINVLTCTPFKENGHIFLSINDQIEFSIPNDKQALIEKNNLIGKSIKIGIRPEYLSLSKDNKNNIDLNYFPSTVEVVEMMGAESYVFFELNNEQMIARINSSASLSYGDTAEFELNGEDILLFDPLTDETLY